MSAIRFARTGASKDGTIKPYEQLTADELTAIGVWPYGPELPDDGGIIVRHAIAGFEHLPDFDIRNGEVSDARSLLVRPTIPEGYHWAPVSGIGPDEATDVVDAFVITAHHQLTSKMPEKMTAEQARKAAIVLGTSRAVMTKHYRLTRGDFIGGELASPVINVKKTPGGQYAYKVVAGVAAEKRAEMMKGMEYTDTEKAAVAALLSSSIGTLAVQGYSLMMTGHHYLSDGNSQSRKAFSVIEKQFWSHNDVREWFNTDKDIVQDCAWHKAGHPVIMNLKEQFATDEKVAAMIREAGAGSAASRLPAQETQMRTANSYLALMSTVDPLFRMFGGNADTTELAEMIRVIKTWPRGKGRVGIPEHWPEAITTRKEALDWMGDVLARNAPKVAYCYGFYCALTDQNQTLSAGATGDTLKSSYSLTKLKVQCHATFIEGLLSYTDYSAARNRKRMEGTYVGAAMPFVSE